MLPFSSCFVPPMSALATPPLPPCARACRNCNPPPNRYVIFVNAESVKSLNLGDIIVNALFVSAYIPLVFFVKKTFGWLFFRCCTPRMPCNTTQSQPRRAGLWAVTCRCAHCTCILKFLCRFRSSAFSSRSYFGTAFTDFPAISPLRRSLPAL